MILKEEYQFIRENALDVMGRKRSTSLFWETRGMNKEGFTPPFTLKDADIVREDVLYLSLKAIYMSYDHIPGFEYEFAMDVFGSWEHWVFLVERCQIKQHFQQWREELEIKIRASAVRELIQTSRGSSSSAGNAAKWLADKGWEVKAGRPSKAEKERQLKQDSRIAKDVTEDMERLGLSIVGNK